jgi:hypothetical protein
MGNLQESGDTATLLSPSSSNKGAANETEEECKTGGWRGYGVFKNQGDCVSFLATKSENQPGAH